MQAILSPTDLMGNLVVHGCNPADHLRLRWGAKSRRRINFKTHSDDYNHEFKLLLALLQ
jgi:hypothetical protein